MKKTILQNLILSLLIAVVSSMVISLASEALPPVADAGLPRYAAQDPIVLNGTGSYNPDKSGSLSFSWQQISGPSVIISDTDTATPTISGFVQTDVVQECEFELMVSDGEFTSLPDTVKVIIVPNFGANTLQLKNPPFDPDKPTFIYFAGGDCIQGFAAGSPFVTSDWRSKANLITFPNGYSPDANGVPRTYYKYGDMIILYLSSVAPDYKQRIQTSGWSTGGQPAIDVGIHLNLSYADVRYAVNRVTFFDATTYCRDYSESITAFLGSSVDGEQCWIDAYVSTTEDPTGPDYPPFYENVLNVWFPTTTGDWFPRHRLAYEWYRSSLTHSNLNQFNHGVIAGAYWSVIGPGKNFQLASTPSAQSYKFQWYGRQSSGYMDFYDEPNHPGRLLEPVTLLGPSNDEIIDADGELFSCEVSENAVEYQLIFGHDPYHMVYLFSDTPFPPTESVTSFPFEQCWWTVKAYDQYGSTIHADPMHIKAENVIAQTIENTTTGQTYASIQQAINDAHSGDGIVVSPGICQYLENINFKGKNLTLRSTDPNDSAVVAATILTGDGNGNLITFSNNEDANCVLAGFTITNANNGIYCSGSSPTITNCSIIGNVSAGIKLYMSSNPVVSNCIIAGNGGSGIEMLKKVTGRIKLFNSPSITNCTIVNNPNIGIFEGIPSVINSIIYGNGVQITGSSAVVTYSDIQGGFPGEGNIDADPLFADAANGDYHLLAGSPCIDAGDSTTSIGSEPLPNGGIINMGAYGGTPQASISP